MKAYFILFFIFHILISNGQKITLSSNLQHSSDTEINEIITLWKNYRKACFLELQLKKDSVSHVYWFPNENGKESTDFLKYSIHPTFPMYLLGDIFTYDIRKYHSGLFVIHNILTVKDSLNENVISIFKVCAKKTDTGYKLLNYFDYSKIKLNSFKTDFITYYFPFDFEFDSSAAERTNLYYKSLISEFGLPVKLITYILGGNVDEVNGFIGFDYTVKTSILKKAGFFINPNIILSAQIEHFHEIIHSVFVPAFPRAHNIFHEGIATFLVGNSGYDFGFHLNRLKECLIKNPSMDLTKFDDLNEFIDETNFFYTIGAIFIDYAKQIGGNEKILSLFKSSNTNSELYNIIDIELGIEKENINDFIRNYVDKKK